MSYKDREQNFRIFCGSRGALLCRTLKDIVKIVRIVSLAIGALASMTSALAAPKVQIIKAFLGNSPENNELAMCSLACAMGWQTRASSHLRPQGTSTYDANNIDDFRIDTAWVEGIGGQGKCHAPF